MMKKLKIESVHILLKLSIYSGGGTRRKKDSIDYQW